MEWTKIPFENLQSFTHTHTHTRWPNPSCFSFFPFQKSIGKKLQSCQDEVMGNNSCGSQKRKSLSLMWCLSIPCKPRWAVAAMCIKYLGFTEALDDLPCGILIRRSGKFILHSITVRGMHTWLEAPFQWRLALWPNWSFQHELMGSRWGQPWPSGIRHALGFNPSGLALAKVAFAGKAFQSRKLEVYRSFLFSRYSINIKEWVLIYLVRSVLSVLFIPVL